MIMRMFATVIISPVSFRYVPDVDHLRNVVYEWRKGNRQPSSLHLPFPSQYQKLANIFLPFCSPSFTAFTTFIAPSTPSTLEKRPKRTNGLEIRSPDRASSNPRPDYDHSHQLELEVDIAFIFTAPGTFYGRQHQSKDHS